MQTLDLPCNPTVDPHAPDPSAMSDNSSPIHSQNDNSSKDDKTHVKNNSNSVGKTNESSNSVVVRRERPSRACTQRAAARLQAAAEAEAAMAEAERKRKRAKKEKITARVVKEESEEEGSFGIEDEGVGEEENGEEGGGSPSSSSRLQCSKIVTPLVGELEPAQLPRWNIRSMWQLASIFNFLNVFRDLLNIKVEFSAEEFETALITPNNTLGDVHIPLLKAIPPVTRMALGQNTWVTVLCRKLRDWWHWVAEGDLPIVASHGAEIETYNTLDPGVRVVILKALCDIRVEQEDIRSYIDDSIKRGIHLSVFRKERIGGDSQGISYWYEDDPIIGHRLYREIRKVEVKKGKGKTVAPIPHSSYEWEAVATNFDEFVNVSEKLFSSKNRTEVAVGKKLKNDMLPEIEKVHKRKEKLLKKQHRQALMLDNMNIDGLATGRSLRDRKPVTYTFDDYDRSINEAIKVTKKKQLSPEPYEKREHFVKIEGSSNGGEWGDGGPSQYPRHDSFTAVSANSLDNDDDDDYDDNDDDGYYDDQTTENLDRSNRRRQKPQRYSVNDFVEPLSDNDPDFESDDEIVGEVVYDDEYLRKRNNKRRKTSSSSESEEEYRWNDENLEEEEEEEEEDDDDDNDSLNTDDDDSDNPKPRKFKSMSGRTRRGTKLRSVDELQSGLRRSKRATRNRINYSQYEMSESENELTKHEKSDALDEQRFDESDNEEMSMGSRDYEENDLDKEEDEMMMPENNHQPLKEKIENVDEKQTGPPPEEESNSRDQEEGGDGDGLGKRQFLDLNELAPGSGFDDGPTSTRDDDEDDF
ncbi:hypothetical protein PHJA_001911800 [Phtheirospermum japonicum]|uniref:DDT domain-containing protein n=1 Tax=Phtheirospermum japonicum TaxID=374723 RepID=A0A830CA95_9LAMI|nr:hypothetical protein PHJA_001911800 [Phtheirospermum japonicum]